MISGVCVHFFPRGGRNWFAFDESVLPTNWQPQISYFINWPAMIYMKYSLLLQALQPANWLLYELCILSQMQGCMKDAAKVIFHHRELQWLNPFLRQTLFALIFLLSSCIHQVQSNVQTLKLRFQFVKRLQAPTVQVLQPDKGCNLINLVELRKEPEMAYRCF